MSIERKTAGSAEYTEYKGKDREEKEQEVKDSGFMTRSEEIRSGGKSNPEQDDSDPTFGTPSLKETLDYYDNHRRPSR